jgi:hypothetical protein
VLTGADCGGYTAFIDGGAALCFAACGRFFVFLMKVIGSDGVIVGSMSCLRLLKLGFWIEGMVEGRTDLVRLCCLTIESEEREAWTADVLADGALRSFVEETL